MKTVPSVSEKPPVETEPLSEHGNFPQTIQLTEMERLAAENLNLKMRLLESEYQTKKQEIMYADNAWVASVNARLGADLTKYVVDFKTGTGLLANGTIKTVGN